MDDSVRFRIPAAPIVLSLYINNVKKTVLQSHLFHRRDLNPFSGTLENLCVICTKITPPKISPRGSEVGFFKIPGILDGRSLF